MAILYSVQFDSGLSYSVLFYIFFCSLFPVLFCPILSYSVMYYSVLFCSVLFCSVLLYVLVLVRTVHDCYHCLYNCCLQLPLLEG